MSVERIRAELEAATPGPWAISYLCKGFGQRETRTPAGICSVGEQKRMIVVDVLESPLGQIRRQQADIALIAHAPTYLAALLDVAEGAQQFFSEVDGVDLDEMFASELRDRVDDFRTVAAIALAALEATP